MYQISRRELFDKMQVKRGEGRSTQQSHLEVWLIEKLGVATDNAMRKAVRRFVSRFSSKVFSKLSDSKNVVKRFIQNNTKWLQTVETILGDLNFEPNESSIGRPSIPFAESSDRSKRRKTENLRQNFSTEELTFSAQMKLRDAGRNDAAKLVHEATDTSPSRASKIRRAWMTKPPPLPVSYTEDEALAFIVQAKLSKNQYLMVRQGGKERNVNIYPPYDLIRQAKKRCYPPPECITVTETRGKVQLQGLLDHTAQRLSTLQKEVIVSLPSDVSMKMVLLSKWGCDGSSGHGEYKQRTSDGIECSDSSLFASSLVPLLLYTIKNDTAEQVPIWKNPRPSSTRYCRPIHLQFVSETPATIRNEITSTENEIASLKLTEICLDEKDVTIQHKLVLSMIDGKVSNVITNTASSQRCSICGATPSCMNNLESIEKRPTDKAALHYGLSVLHAWIRFFEYFLHVSYRLDIRKWQAKTSEEKLSVETRKKQIQSKFREQMGLIVDKPKQGGFGNSNDGNTARRFFHHSHESACITGVDEALIGRCAVILRTISSGFAINVSAFHDYSTNTAKMLISTYKWYPLPASVHKVLMHGSQIIASAVLPIGQLSEEAQEAVNKDYKRVRLHNSRKTSREDTMRDLLNMMLVSSDPIISTLRKIPSKMSNSLPSEVIKLLDEPSLICTQDISAISVSASDSDFSD